MQTSLKMLSQPEPKAATRTECLKAPDNAPQKLRPQGDNQQISVPLHSTNVIPDRHTNVANIEDDKKKKSLLNQELHKSSLHRERRGLDEENEAIKMRICSIDFLFIFLPFLNKNNNEIALERQDWIP